MPSDTIMGQKTLQEVVVAGSGQSGVRIKADGSIAIDNSRIDGLMQFFGESDVVRYLKLMPGVTSGSDYASGISVDGSAYSHTIYRIGGAPVFFPYHFGGIFSTFNTSHFDGTTFDRSCGKSLGPNRIGALIDFNAPSAADTTLHASVNVGIIDSGVALSTPIGKKLSVAASARISYINMMYGSMLDSDGTRTRYKFHDLNLTANYHISEHDRLQLNIFSNADNLRFTDDNYAMTTLLKWQNDIASMQWRHDSASMEWRQSAYVSRYKSSLGLLMLDFNLDVPSSVTHAGSNGSLSFSKWGKWSIGYDIGHTRTSPQNVTFGGYISGTPSQRTISATDYSIGAQCDIAISPALRLTPWCKLTGYTSSGYNAVFANPGASVSVRIGDNVLTASIYRSLQTLHEAGFSDIGLASNFWITSTADIRPQRATTASADFMRYFDIPGHHSIKLTAHAYWRRLNNAHEYAGNILSILREGYNVESNIITGDGYALGGNIMLSKEFGRLTGWISYAYGATRLKYPDTDNVYHPSANDLGHAVTAVGRYEINDHIDVSAAWSFSSGRRITPMEHIYIIAENIIVEYGDRNSSRLPDYHHLDLAASYRFGTGGRIPLRHRLSLSVFNAYGRDNVEMQSFVADETTGRYRIRQSKSLFKFLPSLIYEIKF